MTYQVLIGDCIASMKLLPEKSVHTCVTSPPYFGLRDYGMDGQIGLEVTPEAFVQRLVEVFREVWRVLRDDGTLWLNLGDSYTSGGRATRAPDTKHEGARDMGFRAPNPVGLKPKDLIGIPWRVAFAMQADGWYLRQDIIWHKPNPMPESVTDRCTKAHEYIFMFSKSPRYFFDHEAIKEPIAASSIPRLRQNVAEQVGTVRANGGAKTNGNFKAAGDVESGMRNRRSVWTVTTKPFKGAHFATFPPDLIEPCVLAGAPERCCSICGTPYRRNMIDTGQPDQSHKGSSFTEGKTGARDGGERTQKGIRTVKVPGDWEQVCECRADVIGGTVLDPFGGSGTTGGVALLHGRKAILCELNPHYAAMVDARVRSISGPIAQNDNVSLWEAFLADQLNVE